MVIQLSRTQTQSRTTFEDDAATAHTRLGSELRRAIARASIMALEHIRGARLGRRPPLSLAIRWLGNHYVPWAARSAFVEAPHKVNGVVMVIPRPPLGGWGGEFHMALGTYERRELAWVLQRLSPGDLFVDVGAHVGYFSLPAARRVGPSGRVIAIEPTPTSVEVLERNRSLNSSYWIEVIAAAASDRDGRALLNVNNLSPMWNSLHPIRLGSVESMVSVPTIALDGVFAARGWPRMAGLKLDVEGNEKAVLEGARETLDRNPRAFIIFEVSAADVERRERSLETLGMLEISGYRFRRLRKGGEGVLVGAREVMTTINTCGWRDSLFNVVAEKT